MIQKAGSHGHFCFPVRVQRNGSFFSIADMMEDADDRWLERLGLDPEGALYKMYANLGGPAGMKKDPAMGKHKGSPGPGEPFE